MATIKFTLKGRVETFDVVTTPTIDPNSGAHVTPSSKLLVVDAVGRNSEGDPSGQRYTPPAIDLAELVSVELTEDA